MYFEGCKELLMIIKTELDKKYKEIELHVCNENVTDKVKEIVGELHEIFDESLQGVDEKGNRCQLRPAEIVSFYSEGQRVIALGGREKYIVQNKLYELEEEFGKSLFIRISKSEIVNVKKIKSLDMSITGTIRVIMKNDYETYVSRRNVARIKERLVKSTEREATANMKGGRK